MPNVQFTLVTSSFLNRNERLRHLDNGWNTTAPQNTMPDSLIAFVFTNEPLHIESESRGTHISVRVFKPMDRQWRQLTQHIAYTNTSMRINKLLYGSCRFTFTSIIMRSFVVSCAVWCGVLVGSFSLLHPLS